MEAVDQTLKKRNPNCNEECCSYPPTVVAHNENETAFIIEAGCWNGSKDVSYSQSSANQCINIKNHKQEPGGNSQLLHIIVSLREKNNLQGNLRFCDDVL